MTSAGSASFVYDPASRLRDITSGGTTTRFLYDGVDLIAEYNGSSLIRRYVHGPGVDEPLIWYENGNRSNLFADERGSIVRVEGAFNSTNTYDAYGGRGSGNTGRFQYTGQVWLSEAGLYYYKARMYNPEIGRFMQTDPIGFAGGMNLYGYVGGDPINLTDPSGLDSCDPSSVDSKGYETVVPCGNQTGPGLPDWPWIYVGNGDLAGDDSNGGEPQLQLIDNKCPSLSDRRKWHDLMTKQSGLFYQLAGFRVAYNVHLQILLPGEKITAVADFVATTPVESGFYFIGEIKTGDAKLSFNQMNVYNQPYARVLGKGATNLGLLPNEIIPLYWDGPMQFPGCPS